MLPTSKSKKETNPSKFTILLYGEPKIGKSEACARIENALFIQTEAGLKNLEVYTTGLLTTWEDFKKVGLELVTKEHSYETVIIDTIDGLYQLCAKYICKQNGWKHESEPDFGKAYALIKLELMRTLHVLSSQPFGLVLVGHAKTKELKTKVGKAYDKVTLNFSNTIEEAITSFVDIALYAMIERDVDNECDVRVVKSLSNPDYFAGGRVDLFENNMLLSDLFATKKEGGTK
jgi:hypothetical protein